MYLQKGLRKKGRKKIFFVGLWKVTDEKREPNTFVTGTDPDQYQNVTDPENCVAVLQMILKERKTYTDLHELLADGADVLAEGGGEHHHLLLVRCRAEYLLHQVNKLNFSGAATGYSESGSGEINQAQISNYLKKRHIKWKNGQICKRTNGVADTGCLSRIRDPDFYPFRIPDLGSRILDPGSWIPDPKTATKERGQKISCQTFFCSHKFHKI
jgi:hypothetical protein